MRAVGSSLPRIDAAAKVTGSARFPGAYCALKGGSPVFGATSIADGIAVREPGSIMLQIAETLIDDVVLVDVADIEQAIVTYDPAIVRAVEALALTWVGLRSGESARLVGDAEPEVEQEPLARLALLRKHAVAAVELEPVQLQLDHAHTVRATVSACTCGTAPAAPTSGGSS